MGWLTWMLTILESRLSDSDPASLSDTVLSPASTLLHILSEAFINNMEQYLYSFANLDDYESSVVHLQF